MTPRRDYSTEETPSGAWVSRKHGEYGASVTARERTPTSIEERLAIPGLGFVPL